MRTILESLVISAAAWETTVPGLLLDQRSLAIGELRVNHLASPGDVSEREFLLSSLRRASRFPSGRDEPPLSDRVLVMTAVDGEWVDLEQLCRRLQPLPTQCWVVLVLGLGRDGGDWSGMIIERCDPRPLLRWRVVAPGMLSFVREGELSGEPMDLESFERWSRTRGAIGEETVERLRQAEVAIVGAGRNGTELAWELAALGVKKLVLVDPDQLEIANLDAMPGHLLKDARSNKNKALALAERLAAFRGDDLVVRALPHAITNNSVVEALRGVNVICTAVDNDTPRLGTAILANRYLKIHCDVASGASINEQGERVLAGDVRLLLPNQGCVVCVGGLPNETEARRELFAPPGALRPRRPVFGDEAGRVGSLLPINAATVSVATLCLIDLFSDRLTSSVWHRLRWVEGSGMEVHHAEVSRRDDCSICRPAR